MAGLGGSDELPMPDEGLSSCSMRVSGEKQSNGGGDGIDRKSSGTNTVALTSPTRKVNEY
jgi:hypothetical protein